MVTKTPWYQVDLESDAVLMTSGVLVRSVTMKTPGGNMLTNAPGGFGVWCTSDDIRCVAMKTPGGSGVW